MHLHNGYPDLRLSDITREYYDTLPVMSVGWAIRNLMGAMKLRDRHCKPVGDANKALHDYMRSTWWQLFWLGKEDRPNAPEFDHVRVADVQALSEVMPKLKPLAEPSDEWPEYRAIDASAFDWLPVYYLDRLKEYRKAA